METDMPGATLAKPIPFDSAKLDALLDEAGIDVLVATSKHNVQYLLGGYSFFFFQAMDAIGVSRYLPAVVYQRGRPDTTGYVGNSMESYERDRLWPPNLMLSTWTSFDSMERVVEHIGRLGPGVRSVGVEASFLPTDADKVLRQGLGNCAIVDALLPLERLRAVKTPAEIDMLRLASERVVDCMASVFKSCEPGKTKQQLADELRLEEVKRGLNFDYCLLTAGTSLNRAPSPQVLAEGDILSLDSGGNYQGYIGDLCRMGILGEPDSELIDLLGEIDAVQMAARKPVKAGTIGGTVLEAAQALMAASPHKASMHFMAHGMGLVSHEAPRLMHNGPVPYPGYDRERPLEAGMILSIETTIAHAKRGFIKLEDTVLVTPQGCEGLGDTARGWNRAGD
jgi:Xaa-Pro aminopeptidase